MKSSNLVWDLFKEMLDTRIRSKRCPVWTVNLHFKMADGAPSVTERESTAQKK